MELLMREVSATRLRRREMVMVLGAALVQSSTGSAQVTDRIPRVGLLFGLPEGDPDGQARLATFHQRLHQLGWTEGRNIHVEVGWGGGEAGRIRALAKEIVERQPDIVIGHATVAVEAFLQLTQTIPIIFVAVSDPVGSRFIPNERDPGVNITGVKSFDENLGRKWLEVLKEIAPATKRVGCLFNPDTTSPGGVFMRAVEAAARSFAVEILAAPARSINEIKTALATLGRGPNGLVVIPEPFTATNRDLIIASAAASRVPAVYPNRFFAKRGGLISYGIDQADLLRAAAEYADRILRGAGPNQLAIQGPTKFELAINLATAKTLGLTIPSSLQARADEVIE